MNCLGVAAVLDLFCEDLLTPARRAQVERHVKACPACARSTQVLRPGRAKAPAAPSALKQRLRLALAQPTAAPKTPIKGRLPARGDGWNAALLLAAFALGLLALHAPWRLP